MAKNKKKKYFQGMEHLQETAEQSKLAGPVSSQEPALEYSYISRDLISVIVLMSVFFLMLAGLAVLDKKTDYLTTFSHKITSFLIK